MPRIVHLALLCLFSGGIFAEIAPHVFAPFPAEGRIRGDASQFVPTSEGVSVTWDSSRTNSFFYFPLGLTLTRADRFTFSFHLELDEIAIGTTPGKPYTFQIAAGLIGTETAFDPEMFRGTGVNPTHGARNLVEWNYFPDSGFGATIGTAIATASNQIGFSHNHPIELASGQTYRFELSFDPVDQTLRARMWQGSSEAILLQDLMLADTFSDFRVDAFAISSYSDAGQGPQFAGSIRAMGRVSGIRVIVHDRPTLELAGDKIRFPTSVGWIYHLEETADLRDWVSIQSGISGSGATVEAEIEPSQRIRMFRVRAERTP